MSYYIMTDRSTRQTTRRKALLHAARTADSLDNVGSTIAAHPDPCFMTQARYIYMKTMSRGVPLCQLDGALSKMYLHGRLRTRKLQVGIDAIKRLRLEEALPPQTTYKVIDSRKSKWLIQSTVGRPDANGQYRYTVEKYLIGRQQDRNVWIHKVPSAIRTCLEALDYYRAACRFSQRRKADRRKGGDRRSWQT